MTQPKSDKVEVRVRRHLADRLRHESRVAVQEGRRGWGYDLDMAADLLSASPTPAQSDAWREHLAKVIYRSGVVCHVSHGHHEFDEWEDAPEWVREDHRHHADAVIAALPAPVPSVEEGR